MGMGPAFGFQALALIMQDATIAHEGAAKGQCRDLTGGQNTVLQGHTIISLIAVSLTSG